MQTPNPSSNFCLGSEWKEPLHIAPNFYLYSRREKARITSYVNLFPTKNTDKKTSKMDRLFLLDALASGPWVVTLPWPPYGAGCKAARRDDRGRISYTPQGGTTEGNPQAGPYGGSGKTTRYWQARLDLVYLTRVIVEPCMLFPVYWL